MSVKYVLTAKGNPGKPEEPQKYYAQAKADGEVTFKKLGKEIAEGSTTVSDSDVLAVLNDLTKCLNRHLAEGRIVRFGDFGSFQISLSSEGAETEEKFHQSLIRGGKVTFRPGQDLRDMLSNLKYEKMK
jgi:predicted histone-like DNA-binding protein